MKPKNHTIYIRQGATVRYNMQFAFDCTEKTVRSHVLSRNRKRLLADCTIEWVNRVAGRFNLVIPHTTTAYITEEGIWELMVIDNASQERDYHLTGVADWVPGSMFPPIFGTSDITLDITGTARGEVTP
jgi:hypothetical protein